MAKKYAIEDLIKEHDKILNLLLKKEKADFTKLREICSDFNEEDDYFIVDGTNMELWKSVNAFLSALSQVT